MFFGPACPNDTAAAQIVCLLGTILTIAIIARALLSWFNMDPSSPLIQALNAITDPIIEPIRRIMPRLGMIDLSPLVALLAVQFIAAAIANLLNGNG